MLGSFNLVICENNILREVNHDYNSSDIPANPPEERFYFQQFFRLPHPKISHLMSATSKEELQPTRRMRN